MNTDERELARIKALREKHSRLVGDVNPHNHTVKELKDLSAFIEKVIADIDIPTGELTDHDHDGVDASKVDWGDLDNRPSVFPPDTHAHTTTDLTGIEEYIQDTVGAMVTGNTETNITVSYEDSTGKLNFVAEAEGGGAGEIDEDIIFVIDGGGAEIADNATIWRQVNFDATITSWTLLADASGSIVIDIWKDTLANFPPTDADTITASALPTISSATNATSSTLTGWTTSITAGDVLKINVDSCTTIKTCVLQLKVQRA